MKKFNKIVSLLLALVMVLSLAACGGKTTTPSTTAPVAATEATAAAEYVDPYADIRDDYDALSEAIYNDVLGDFITAYDAGKAVTDNVSERYALMAIAEAKLLESATLMPLTAKGGNYAISRVAPYTFSSVLWGNDAQRYHNAIVTTEPIKTADRDELKALWAELKGTGTYAAEATKLLESKGYTIKDTYAPGGKFSSDPQTWDILATSRSADAEAIVNTYDGLVEYDCENVMQPALAESWEVSDDGLTYTFHLRQGAKWVDSQGREVGEVKADDFVAGMQHMMDVMGGLEYLIEGIIVNASEYISGDVTDFAEVGVKAVDDYTVEYTLCQPTSFFMTMLGYNVFAPMCRSYYESKGGKFGADFDNSAASYTYGKTPSDIAYCGPYLVSNFTSENTIVFTANPAYWNKDNITIKTLTWLYNDGQDALKAYNDTMSGVLDGAGLNASAAEQAKTDGVFDTLAYVSATDATTFSAFLNVNRAATSNVNDGSVVSPKDGDEEAMTRTHAAFLNVHFRRAIMFALDRATYNAQTVGEDLKYASMVNTYTPGNFVSLEEDTTVDINGTATTFPAGTYYGAIMQAQIDADGLTIKVWDPEAEGGAGSSTQFDGWYNPDEAAAELATAVEELAAEGVEVSAENPIYMDIPYFSGSEAYGNRANALKKSIETVLGGAVIVNLVECVDSNAWYYAGYYTDFGYEANYDFYDVSGWGPDYGDPQTYLDTFLPDYSGYMVKCIGLF